MNNNKLYFPQDVFKQILEDNIIEVKGKKINKYIIRNIFFTKRLFDYTLKFFNDEISHFRISCEEYYANCRDIRLSKVELILLMYKVAELDSKNPDLADDERVSKEDIKLFEDYCSTDILLKSFEGKTKEYTIEGNKYTIKFDDIWNFYNCPEEEYQQLLKSNTIYGIKKEYFIYACINYFDYYITDYYILPENIYNRFKSLSHHEIIDTEAINVINENDNPDSKKTKINKELRNAILKDIPESLSKLEKAIYIYIKMCILLSYDDEYYALNQKSEKLTRNHKDIDYISTITKDNSKVVCYEFNAIYAKLLEELGINCIITRSIFSSYGNGHASLNYRVGKYLISADSSLSILNGDMIKAKLNEKLEGLSCVNMNENSRNEFNKALDKVYNLIINSEKKSGLEEIISEYRIIKEKEEKKVNIPIEKKLRIISLIVNRLQVSDMDRIAFIIYLMKKIFTDEERNNIQSNIIKTKDTKSNNKYASPTIIFTIKDNYNNLKYYQYLPRTSLMELDDNYLQVLFDLKILSYIKEENGIKNNKGGIIK